MLIFTKVLSREILPFFFAVFSYIGLFLLESQFWGFRIVYTTTSISWSSEKYSSRRPSVTKQNSSEVVYGKGRRESMPKKAAPLAILVSFQSLKSCLHVCERCIKVVPRKYFNWIKELLRFILFWELSWNRIFEVLNENVFLTSIETKSD